MPFVSGICFVQGVPAFFVWLAEVAALTVCVITLCHYSWLLSRCVSSTHCSSPHMLFLVTSLPDPLTELLRLLPVSFADRLCLALLTSQCLWLSPLLGTALLATQLTQYHRVPMTYSTALVADRAS